MPGSVEGIETQWLGRISYRDGLARQEEIHARVLGGGPGQFLLLEHDPVYTIGRTRDRSSLIDESALPHQVVEINRGGQATYHGPGQLVGYLILELTPYGKDLHAFLRALEDGLIAACAAAGIEARSREGLTGVWAGDRKIASIGVGVRRWVTMHGFALNVRGPLDGFEAIVPCGIGGVEMTSVDREGGQPTDLRDFAALADAAIRDALEDLRRNQGG